MKEEEAAALRIQSLYRGQKDRQTVKAMAAQEAQAAPRRATAVVQRWAGQGWARVSGPGNPPFVGENDG